MKNHLSQVSARVTTQIAKFFDEKIHAAKATDEHLVGMIHTLKKFMMRRGKGVRPFLCWCAYMLAGGNEEEKIIQAATAIEFLHYYILNLDDMADRDRMRHGGPTLEVMYQKKFADWPARQAHYGRDRKSVV